MDWIEMERAAARRDSENMRLTCDHGDARPTFADTVPYCNCHSVVEDLPECLFVILCAGRHDILQ